ncbi:MAG: hypothetical protein RLP09_32365, partial [Sandaracinaceae bacterium]
MKALTLHRPWSDAIVHSTKRVENRTWRPPASAIGCMFAIHAGQRFDADSVWPEGDRPRLSEDSPTGIVGVARLRGWIRVSGAGGFDFAGDLDDAAARAAGESGWFIPGCIGWVLERVIPIPPIECGGHQRLWTLSDHLRERVMLRAKFVDFGSVDARPRRVRIAERQSDLERFDESELVARAMRTGARHRMSAAAIA